MKIGIVNSSIGNVGSVYSAFEFYGYEVSLINSPHELKAVNLIVLAGVGNFSMAVSKLKELKLWDKINREVTVNKKPVLGICLGMQLFADKSYEDGESDGFGWINGNVVKLDNAILRVPHIGWDEVEVFDRKLFKGVRYNNFYFMHSYHFIPKNPKVIISYINCGDSRIVSAVRQDNIIGVQFHPEKSQGDGLRFLKNVVETFA